MPGRALARIARIFQAASGQEASLFGTLGTPLCLLAVAGVVMSLSGCWFKSVKPLIAADEAAFPFTAISLAPISDGNEPGSAIMLVREGSAYSNLGEGTQSGDAVFDVYASNELRLTDVGENLYVAQARMGDTFFYGLVQIDLSNKSALAFNLTAKYRDVSKGLSPCVAEDQAHDPDKPVDDGICVNDLNDYVGLGRTNIATGEKPEASYAIREVVVAEAGSLQVGLAAFQNGDYLSALSVAWPLANAGNAEAQALLGVIYQKGNGVAQNNAAALKWYRRAAVQGNVQAQNNLGVMFEKGEGVPQNAAEAEKWYALAAARDQALAKKNLADIRSKPVQPTTQTPADAATYEEQGRESLLLQDWDSAIVNFEMAIQLKPDDAAIVGLRDNAMKQQQEYDLSGDNWWVLVASRQTPDDAIAIARDYIKQGVRVVRAKNGWYAVIFGPVAATDISTFRIGYNGTALPPDAMLKRGIGFIDTIWAPAIPTLDNAPVNELCRRALNWAKADWDTGDQYREAVNEAKRRNLNVDRCRAAIGFPKLSDRPLAERPADAICASALNGSREDWETEAPHSQSRAEAKRRNLSIDDCREAIGLPRLAERMAGTPVAELCSISLSTAKDGWEGPAFAVAVAEAKRRHLSIDDCRVATGLPPLAKELAEKPVRELCDRALNVGKTNWDGGPPFERFVAETKRRNLTVDDCRAALGLPRLVVLRKRSESLRE